MVSALCYPSALTLHMHSPSDLTQTSCPGAAPEKPHWTREASFSWVSPTDLKQRLKDLGTFDHYQLSGKVGAAS